MERGVKEGERRERKRNRRREGERETGGKADKKETERGQNQRLWVGGC